ncbi:MAG: hypothetical protein HZB68_00295 [Candidatus Aenigmarchaeota archaeon]|nr:hypothetical protein [Candidatus Aenigmarchaeota archaeon]
MARKLIYVPLYHSYEEIEGIVEPIIDRAVKKSVGVFGRGKAKKEIKSEIRDVMNSSVNKYWDAVENDVDKLIDDYGSLSVFQEGIYWGDDTAKSQAKSAAEAFGTRNFSYVFKLAEKGAKIRETEDMEAYFAHLANNKVSLKNGKETNDSGHIDRRDSEIAKRINEKLDGNGILFLGSLHNALQYIEDDIEVTTVKPFDASMDMRVSLGIVLAKRRGKK